MKNRELKVLVTGSEGFIGRHLCYALSRHPNVKTVLHLDRKISNPLYRPRNIVIYYDIQQCMIDEPDVVFHLAAETKVEYNDRTGDIIDTNIVGTHLLLDNLPKNCRFIFVSSVHATQPTSVYGASKAAGEALVQAYNAMDLCEGVILRLTSCVGKGMTHGVVKALIKMLTTKRSDTIQLVGNFPGSKRPFVHVNDVVRALIHFGIENDSRGETHNISCADSVNIVEVAGAVMDSLNVHKYIKWSGTSWKGDLPLIEVVPTEAIKLKYKDSLSAIKQAVKDNL
jgi:UDP-glucose 4-epimerase